MGTDFLELFDRRSAEIVVHGDALELVALVDARNKRNQPHIWQRYWHEAEERFIDFAPGTTNAERLKTKIDYGKTLEEIKEDLLRDVFTMQFWLYVDYWGCASEVFPIGLPPGALTWEEFTAPIWVDRAISEKRVPGSQGCFLLTAENVASILKGLKNHRNELQIMGDPEIAKLESWYSFCHKYPGFCILYQVDF
ncbi:MAG TPA: hypothetical protein VKH81_23775 [Candidatus Angelobacter sp.]|nr:hypothetical protein [Candidatus Angelobacter sp.]